MSYCNSKCNSPAEHAEEDFEDLLRIAFGSGMNENPENDPIITTSSGLSAAAGVVSSGAQQQAGAEDVAVEPYGEFEKLLKMVGLIEEGRIELQDATPLLGDNSRRSITKHLLVEKGIDNIYSTTTTDKYSFCVRKGLNGEKDGIEDTKGESLDWNCYDDGQEEYYDYSQSHDDHRAGCIDEEMGSLEDDEDNDENIASSCEVVEAEVSEATNNLKMKSSNKKAVQEERRSTGDTTSTPIRKRKTPNNEDLKTAMFDRSMFYFDQSRCNCSDKNCFQGIRGCFQEVIEQITYFWGPRAEPCPNRQRRRELCFTLLRKAFCATEKTFLFKFGNNSQKVCELCYVRVIGAVQRRGGEGEKTIWRPCNPWSLCRKAVLEGVEDIEQLQTYIKDAEKEVYAKNQSIFDHAAAYIANVAQSQLVDASPFKGLENVGILPYTSMAEFYGEYVHHCNTVLKNSEEESMNYYNNMGDDDEVVMIRESYIPDDEASFASISTFKRAFKNFNEDKNQSIQLRLARCKGHFQCCEVCNKASDVLKSTRLNAIQRLVIRKIKRQHLLQQQHERQNLERQRQLCREKDELNQPKCALLFCDGMTIYTTQTPKISKENSKEGVKKIETRIIGIEVTCGDINTTFIYYTDDMVSGGALTMIEIQRQAVKDLEEMLVARGHLMPRKIVFQFDNCGENKNKYMMCYLSLLVEEREFDEIQMNYLIVGHTHSSIDQFFSTLSKAIFNADFIGSPLALCSLFQQAVGNRISIMRQISVFYDFPSAITPFLNKDIKYFQIPHCFKFTRIHQSKCIMQYKLFSTNKVWLPLEPSTPPQISKTSKENSSSSSSSSSSTSAVAIIDETQMVHNVALQSNAILGGDDVIYESLEISGVTADKASSEQSKFMNVINQNSFLMSQLRKDSIAAALEQQLRMEDEEQGIFQDAKNRRVIESREIETALRESCTSKQGYIVWLKTDKRKARKKKANLHQQPEGLDTAPQSAEEIMPSTAEEVNVVYDINPVKLSPKSLIEKIEAKHMQERNNQQRDVLGVLAENASLMPRALSHLAEEDADDNNGAEDLSGALERCKAIVAERRTHLENEAEAEKDKEAGEKEDEKNNKVLLVDGMRCTAKEKTMLNGAKKIAEASRYVLRARDNPDNFYFKIAQGANDNPVFTNDKLICRAEEKFYEENRTEYDVLKRLLEKYDSAPDKWTARIKVRMTEEALAKQKYFADLAKAQLEEAIRTSKTISKPSHDNSDEMRESIARPGLDEAYGSTVQTEKNNKKKASAAANNAVVSTTTAAAETTSNAKRNSTTVTGKHISGAKDNNNNRKNNNSSNIIASSNTSRKRSAEEAGLSLSTNPTTLASLLPTTITREQDLSRPQLNSSCNVKECQEPSVQSCDCCVVVVDSDIKYCSIHWQHSSHHTHELNTPCPKKVKDLLDKEIAEEQQVQLALSLLAARRQNQHDNNNKEGNISATVMFTIDTMEADLDKVANDDDCNCSNFSIQLANSMCQVARNVANKKKGIILDTDMINAHMHANYNDSYSEIVKQIFRLTDYVYVMEALDEWERKLQARRENTKKSRLSPADRLEIASAITKALIQKYNLAP